MPRHNIYWVDPDLWNRVQEAARRESVRRGEDVSASQLLAEWAEAALRKRRAAAAET